MRGAVRILLGACLMVPAWSLPLQADTFCTGARLPEDVADRAFSRPMAYLTVRAGGSTVLQATGEIRPGESTRLREAMARAGKVDEVWLHSPGGAASEGTRMGRVLRQAGVLTRLRANQACVSACSIAFLGGVVRVVEPRGYFGIHMMTASRDTPMMIGMMDELGQLSRLRKAALRRHVSEAGVDQLVADAGGRYVRALEQLAATIAAEQARYLVEMSVSLEFMTEEFAQSAQGVCYLGEAGLRKFNVANASAPAPVLPPAAPLQPNPLRPDPLQPAPAAREPAVAAQARP